MARRKPARSKAKSRARAKPRSRKKSTRRSKRLPDLKRALRVPQKERDYGLLVLTAVALVAVIALVMTMGGDATGEAFNVPANQCDQFCGEGYRGQPIGAHGRASFCKCVPDMGSSR